MTENNLITTEEWRPVVGYEGVYSVSNCGRVRREIAGPGTYAGRIMKLSMSTYGYHRVILMQNKQRRDHFVHRLVAAAFIGECPDGHQVNHKDGVKLHNNPENLEYVTARENTAHATAMGLMAKGDKNSSRLYPERVSKGENHVHAKLTANKVREIRAAYQAGNRTMKSIGDDYGVCDETVSMIIHRKTWKHVA